MGEFAENLDGPRLPPALEEYLAQERRWHRFLRETGAVTAEESKGELERWTER
ncbi:hypothetical protein ABQE62_05860 [Mycolicibacterium fortuitum]